MKLKLKLLRPVDVQYPISSPYGMRKHPLSGKSVMHHGIDFSVPIGTEIMAMANGKVFKSGWEDPHNARKGFGLRVWQEAELDGEIYYLWYSHLNSIWLKEKHSVEIGQIIGMSGDTGHSTGPHLHVQARKKDTGNYFDIEFYQGENHGKYDAGRT